MKSGWITHQDKQIFFCHYDHIGIDKLRDEISQVEEIFRQQPENSIPLLVDVKGTIIAPDTLQVLTKTSIDMKKFIKRTAVLGVTGVRMKMLDMLIKVSGLQVKPFEDEELAKSWLLNSTDA
jgi:hypothetical protein